jgi:hypothetical protein
MSESNPSESDNPPADIQRHLTLVPPLLPETIGVDLVPEGPSTPFQPVIVTHEALMNAFKTDYGSLRSVLHDRRTGPRERATSIAGYCFDIYGQCLQIKNGVLPLPDDLALDYHVAAYLHTNREVTGISVLLEMLDEALKPYATVTPICMAEAVAADQRTPESEISAIMIKLWVVDMKDLQEELPSHLEEIQHLVARSAPNKVAD